MGHNTPLHDLSKLTGVTDLTTDVSPENPGRQAQSEIEDAPMLVWLLPGGQGLHEPIEPLAAYVP